MKNHVGRFAWLYSMYWLFPLMALVWCLIIRGPFFVPAVLGVAVGVGIRRHIQMRAKYVASENASG